MKHTSVDARSRPIALKSKTNSRITKTGRRVLHDTCYIAYPFQGQRSRSQAHIVCTSYLLPLLHSWKKNVVPVSLRAGGGIPCRPNLAATLLVDVVFVTVCIRIMLFVLLKSFFLCIWFNWNYTVSKQEAHLSQRNRAMLPVIEYFAN